MVEEFARLDLASLSQTQQTIRSAHAPGVQRFLYTDRQQYQRLAREASKKRQIWPVRKLMATMPELLLQAGKVVREYRRASVSLLQRRLSIGYSRATRLLDQLEERGIVGPSEDGRTRVVLDSENDRAERDQAQERAGRADPKRDAAWERAARAEAERDEAQAQVRAHAARRRWLARLLRWWDLWRPW